MLPRIAVIGVPSDWRPNRVAARINDDLDLPENDPDEVISKYKFGDRNSTTCTWVIECKPNIRNIILNRKKLYLGWSACPVRDHVRILRCFKCQGFGHMASVCKNKAACSRCTGEHDTKDCTNNGRPSCINCIRAKVNEEECFHEACDNKCVTYNRRLQAHINNTDYGQ
ncbi:unnamed protein product [Phaedon cochleariae]|uniref:CCHC-type domain-containing protein n=1 Tax=Phaedon cochleariae TaxID=80249 RepID=A0A9N9SL85_PHACE|nr:unnamed protein product [Phaedon cochleariae]